MDFNTSVLFGMFYINLKPILHVINEATKYQAAFWLLNLTADSVWTAMKLC